MVARPKRDIGHFGVIQHILNTSLLTLLVFCMYLEREKERTNAAFG